MGVLFPWTTARKKWFPIEAKSPRPLEYEREPGGILRDGRSFLEEIFGGVALRADSSA